MSNSIDVRDRLYCKKCGELAPPSEVPPRCSKCGSADWVTAPLRTPDINTAEQFAQLMAQTREECHTQLATAREHEERVHNLTTEIVGLARLYGDNDLASNIVNFTKRLDFARKIQERFDSRVRSLCTAYMKEKEPLVEESARAIDAATIRSGKGIRVPSLVRTTKATTSDADWTPEVRIARRWGVEGVVIKESNAHGLCYQVRHDDGSTGWYAPTELEPLDGNGQPVKHPDTGEEIPF